MLAVSGDGVVSLLKGTQEVPLSAGVSKTVAITERHEYHVELILKDEDASVEGALISEKKEGVKGSKVYQLVEVSRLQLSPEARPAGDTG